MPARHRRRKLAIAAASTVAAAIAAIAPAQAATIPYGGIVQNERGARVIVRCLNGSDHTLWQQPSGRVWSSLDRCAHTRQFKVLYDKRCVFQRDYRHWDAPMPTGIIPPGRWYSAWHYKNYRIWDYGRCFYKQSFNNPR